MGIIPQTKEKYFKQVYGIDLEKELDEKAVNEIFEKLGLSTQELTPVFQELAEAAKNTAPSFNELSKTIAGK